VVGSGVGTCRFRARTGHRATYHGDEGRGHRNQGLDEAKERSKLMSDLSTALKKLRKLMTLPDGWNYGEGGKPSRRALMSAALALQHLDALDAQRVDILPADNFGVTIMASHED